MGDLGDLTSQLTSPSFGRDVKAWFPYDRNSRRPTATIVTRESYSLEANNALLFYLSVHLFLVPSLLEGASNFCEGAKHMAEGTHAAGYDQKIVVL